MSTKETATREDAGQESLADTHESLDIRMVQLNDLQDERGDWRVIKVRERLNEEAVEDYADKMEAGRSDEFPPIIAYYDDAKQEWNVSQGGHRLAAAALAGLERIKTEVRHGDRRAATLDAVGSNASNAVRRTREDKREAVWRMLEDAEWGKMSDRAIATQCDVSPTFVGNVRVQWDTATDASTVHVDSSPESPTDNIIPFRPRGAGRVGLDGKTRQVPQRRAQPVSPATTADDDEDYEDDEYEVDDFDEVDDDEVLTQPTEQTEAVTKEPQEPVAPPVTTSPAEPATTSMWESEDGTVLATLLSPPSWESRFGPMITWPGVGSAAPKPPSPEEDGGKALEAYNWVQGSAMWSGGRCAEQDIHSHLWNVFRGEALKMMRAFLAAGVDRSFNHLALLAFQHYEAQCAWVLDREFPNGYTVNPVYIWFFRESYISTMRDVFEKRVAQADQAKERAKIRRSVKRASGVR